MPKYKVTAILETGYETYIEAKDDDDAFKKAQDMELEDFEENDHGHFRIYDTWKAREK
tara:strand:- start:575 stop:748 length:174 start_codon:yes stop_codon:yes gene_type:complete